MAWLTSKPTPISQYSTVGYMMKDLSCSKSVAPPSTTISPERHPLHGVNLGDA